MTEHDHPDVTDEHDEEPTTEVTDETIAESIGDAVESDEEEPSDEAAVTETAFDETPPDEPTGSSTDRSVASAIERDSSRESGSGPRSARSSAGNAGSSNRSTDSVDRASEVRRYLAWGSLFVLSLLAVFALIQFYASATDAIDLWIEPKYQPIMRAAFNLAVLLAAGAGVSLSVRELA